MENPKLPLGVATFVVILSAICTAFIYLVPGFSLYIMQSWFHGMDLNLSWNPSFNLVSFILGLITMFIASYATAWLFIKIYKLIVK